MAGPEQAPHGKPYNDTGVDPAICCPTNRGRFTHDVAHCSYAGIRFVRGAVRCHLSGRHEKRRTDGPAKKVIVGHALAARHLSPL